MTEPQFESRVEPRTSPDPQAGAPHRSWAGTVHTGSDLAADVLRGLTAAAVLLSAAVHFQLWATGFRRLDTIGPAFLLNAVGGIVIGILLTAWRSWVPPLLAVGFGVLTLGAFLWSTTPRGLFGVHERWASVPVWLAAAAELAAILGGIAILAVELPDRR